MRGSRGTRQIALAGIGAAALALAGCGDERQDANEPAGTYTVEIVDAKFPAKQQLAQRSTLTLAVRNASPKPLPNVAVTVDSFARDREQPGLADPSRPVWILDAGPRGGDSAYVNTWQLGALAPGQTRTFSWRVTAVAPGVHTVKYKVAAGLDGRAKAQLASGRAPEGSFTVRITDKPSQARVDSNGDVVREPAE